jgi:hypothetical protein
LWPVAVIDLEFNLDKLGRSVFLALERSTHSMILETEKSVYGDLAVNIGNIDPDVLFCVIISNPQGSILARSVKPEFQKRFADPPQTYEMVAHWALLAFNAMKRLNTVRSKAKFIMVQREELKTLIFPASLGNADLMMVLTINLDHEPAEIYERAMRLISGASDQHRS